jgi:hypothetical protein
MSGGMGAAASVSICGWVLPAQQRHALQLLHTSNVQQGSAQERQTLHASPGLPVHAGGACSAAGASLVCLRACVQSAVAYVQRYANLLCTYSMPELYRIAL